jgi:hypothetical protein
LSEERQSDKAALAVGRPFRNVVMLVCLQHFRLSCLLGLSVAIAGNARADAGWMGFRNDMKDTIVIQETLVINGQNKPGRPQRLFTGDAIRDTQFVGPQRRISIFDLKNTKQPIYTGNFNCPAANENLLYCIKSDGKGGVTIEVIKTPAAPNTPPKK